MDFNWSTLLLQTVNFLILTYVLARFLFKPIKEMLEKRSQKATAMMDQAEESAQQAEALRQEYERKRDSIDAEFSALKNEARLVIDETRQQMLREAYDEIEVMRARAREEIEQQRADALRLHRTKIGELVATLVQRMLQDVLTPPVHQAYLEAFLEQLQGVQLTGRVAAESDETVSAEVITATALSKDDQKQIAATLEDAIAKPVDLIFRDDSDLIAGAMVRLGDMLIDGSLRGQIDQLRDRYEEEIG